MNVPRRFPSDAELVVARLGELEEREIPKARRVDEHPANVAGCCDGRGQVHHGQGALSFVTLCPNGCGAKAWDEECERAERGEL